LRLWCVLAVAGGCACVAACSDPLITRSDYAPPAVAGTPAATQLRDCRISIASILDARLDRETIGSIGPRPVRAPPDTRAWVRNVLVTLQDYGAQVSFDAAGQRQHDELSAAVELKRLWVTNVATSKAVGIVLVVRYERDGALIKEATYRGSVSGINWFGTSDELQATLDEAFGQIVTAMRGDLAALCAHASS
jgi:hypothetical protein